METFWECFAEVGDPRAASRAGSLAQALSLVLTPPPVWRFAPSTLP
jgi:hypothetical protein